MVRWRCLAACSPYLFTASEIASLTALTQELKLENQKAQNRIDQLEGELALVKGEMFVYYTLTVMVAFL